MCFLSLIESTEKLKQQFGNFPWGGCIWTAFLPGEGGIWTKIFQKFKCAGVALGGCWSFDLTGTLSCTGGKMQTTNRRLLKINVCVTISLS